MVSVRSVSRVGSPSAQARARRAFLQRLLPVCVLALGLVVAPLLYFSSGGRGRLARLEEEKKQMNLEISRLARRIDHLQAQAEALRESPAAVERTARDELGLVRRSEVVFQFQKTHKPVQAER